MSHSPVTRETFLQQASIYSTLSASHRDDKLVLIRLPKELSAADLDGQMVELSGGGSEDIIEEGVIGKMTLDLKSKTRASLSRSNSKASNLYTLKSSRRNLKVSSLAITQPSPNVSSLAAPQQMRIGRSFDEFWSLNLGVEVGATPMKKISKIVKKRSELPLLEQPKNLRMRLLPFNTPTTTTSTTTSLTSKTKSKSKNQH